MRRPRNKLRACRESALMSQAAAAAVVDISPSHYAQIERGITGLSAERAVALARAFDCMVEDMID